MCVQLRRNAASLSHIQLSTEAVLKLKSADIGVKTRVQRSEFLLTLSGVKRADLLEDIKIKIG